MSFETEIIENIKEFKDKIAELCDNYSETSSISSDPEVVASPQQLTVRVETIDPKNITLNIEQNVVDRAKYSKKMLMKKFDKILRKQERLAKTNKRSGLLDFFEHICEHKKRYFATGLSLIEAVYIIITTIKRYT